METGLENSFEVSICIAIFWIFIGTNIEPQIPDHEKNIHRSNAILAIVGIFMVNAIRIFINNLQLENDFLKDVKGIDLFFSELILIFILNTLYSMIMLKSDQKDRLFENN